MGLALNVPLWLVFARLQVWRGAEREFGLVFAGASLAVATLAVLAPVFWKGVPWQAPIAFVLMWLPGVLLFAALLQLLRYW